MSEAQDFCLRWSSYSQQLSEALRNLLDRELLVDVTLACDGRSLRAHRTILSACSSYFQELFQESTHPHTIVILKDVKFEELEALVKFMYHGEVTVNNEMLPGFIHTAETLHVRGLTDGTLPSTLSIKSPKVSNGKQTTGSDPGVFVTEQDEDTFSSQRFSPVHIKRIKLEQPTSSPFDHSIRVGHHEHLNDRHADDRNVMEQDVQCSQQSEDLSLISSDQYPIPRPTTSFEGLSQLVMPVTTGVSPLDSHYAGVCSNIQNQLQQLSQQPSSTHQQSTQHGNNSIGNGGSGTSTGRPFRQRVLYNQEQLLQLEAWYCQDRYPSGALMHDYADRLAAMVPHISGSVGAQPLRQNVDYWFQNRRRKDFHPEVMQQREKKKLAKSLWGNYNANLMATPATPAGNSGEISNSNHSEINLQNTG